MECSAADLCRKKPRHIAILYHVIAHKLTLCQNRLLEPLGITQQQSRLMFFLHFHNAERLNQKDMESFMHLSAASVTSLIANLEKGGYVERKTSETDGRAKLIRLTRKGEDTLPAIDETLRQMDEIVTGALTDEEKSCMEELLLKVDGYIMERQENGCLKKS